MQCNILYDGKSAPLRRAVQAYLRTKDFDRFKSTFLRGGPLPQEVRYTLKPTDTPSDIHKSIITFYNDLLDAAEGFSARDPKDIPTINKLLSLVEKEFHIDADTTQSASDEADIETKTREELYDNNRGNLQSHLSEIYGNESFGLLKSLEQDFYDAIVEAAYYNSHTGEAVSINNKLLNANISKLKQTLTNRIKSYLQQNGISFTDNFFGIQYAFYNHIKKIEDLKKRLNSLQSDRIQEKDKDSKLKLYQNLLSELEKDPNFAKKVKSKLNQYRKDRLTTALYAGDCYSYSYLAVRKYVLENRPELSDKISEIEAEEPNLLTAVNAYSMLSHFDEMLVDKLGKQISIQDGTMGLEVEDKYSYHQDTSHEIKGWQTSEDIGSEKHTSRFTQAVLSQIRIFDYKTDDYKNRRLDSTSFIVAARHLMDDLLYKNADFKGTAQYLEKCSNEIKECIVTFHSDPQTKLQKILELLFDTQAEHQREPLVNFLTNKKLLTDYDLDILYSVYLKVFNKQDPSSFISQEISGHAANALGAGLMQEIAAYADSNVAMDYLESKVDWETGEIKLRVKKKYFNNAQLYKLRKAINSEANGKSLEKRLELQGKYDFQMSESNSNTNYSVEVGDMTFTLEVPNTVRGQILVSQDKRSNIKFANKEIFKSLEDVDLVQFRQKLEVGAFLNEKEQDLKSVLQFLDDYLHLNILSNLGLQTLQVYKSTYDKINGMSNYLMPLIQMAIRTAYINDQYIKAGDQKLAKALENDQVYKFFSQNPKSKLFITAYGNIKYVAASFNDEVLDAWVDCISMLTGEASKATTKDGQGNSIPNNSVGKLGGILHHYLNKQKGTNCGSLMFVENPDDIKATFHDLEASNIHGDTKSIRQFSCGELFFHSIFNKFWGSYNKTGNVVIQPTVYSDKTTFLNWEISTDLLNSPDYVNKVLDKYVDTLGTFYMNVYNGTMSKLNQIKDLYNLKYGTNLTVKEVLKKVNESELTALAFELKIELEKDKDYRVKKKKVVVGTDAEGKAIEKTIQYCVINELLEYNNKLYNDKYLLRQYLEHEKYNFLQNLIDYNTSFQVVDFGDNVDHYTKDTIDPKASSKNAVITTILNYYKNSDERKEFFKEWVDAKTGKLILAKQGDRNVLGIGNDFNKKEPGMELNPMLSKFFYVEGLLSNNLRMSLTGSEINHPDKAFGTMFNLVKDPKNNHYVKFNTITGLNLTEKDYLDIKPLLDSADTVGDLAESFDPVLKHIYEKSMLTITNTAQGTQFKRNVIIPATLQYCQQGTKVGIPRKIKGAIIGDEKADVFNYRGETDNVDSADGSALIDPFQSILENLSLGSQAVGFIKKPIWHSYDTNGGTAFLAKFATNTITNETMRSSMHSSTSLYKMFKRMTNMQWQEMIDLTKPIHYASNISEDEAMGGKATYDKWFSAVILEGSRLFYENKSGKKVEILGFNKTTTADGKFYYYTLEQTSLGNPIKVYHMYDKESNHYTFDSYQKAKAFEETGGHTVNSLFELHAALGGINCVDSKGNSSEFNNKVVVNFMNNIGTKKPGVPKNAVVNQENYYQPLKDMHIGYVFNSTAVKNGAKNVNSSKAWKGDTELQYFEIDSDGLGMQMNADHDIVDSELTEFSQVIAATSAYGYTYDNCDEIFKGLAKTAIQASKQVLDATEKFLENFSEEAQSDLYDAIGRIVFMDRSIKDKETLENMIKEAVVKVFNKNKNHGDDSVKMPFSDSNIYTDFVSTLASSITKASIKRKHPGSGCVMAPGYNIVTYFEVGDRKYSHSDILKRARADLINELREIVKTSPKYDAENDTLDGAPFGTKTLQDLLEYPEVITYLTPEDPNVRSLINTPDDVEFNKLVVNRYLDKLQADAPIFTDKSYFQPEDVVRIITPTGVLEQTIVLDSMEKYYAFKNRVDLPGTTYQIDVKTPRNLKPSLIRWKYVNGEGNEVYMNMFDHPVIKGAFDRKGKLDANYRKQVQDVLHNLHDGFFVMDGIRYEVIPGSLENTEAELVMSNIYKDVFGVDNESLQDVLEQGEQYFIDQIDYKLHAPKNKIYDVALLKDSGKHTLIKFGAVSPNERCVENEFTNISINEKDEIYCMKNNKPLFKIGKYVDISGDELDDLHIEGDTIKSKSGKDIDPKQYRIHKTRIQKRIDFVKRYKLTTQTTNRKSGKTFYTTNTMYQLISKDKLVKLYGNEDDAHKQIGSLITDIYNQDNYKFVELNGMNGQKYINQINTIKGYFGWFMGHRGVNPDHKLYIQEQLNSMGDDSKTNLIKLENLKREFYRKEAHKKWVSFQDSLKFISSRIPAQTLQSFMTMKCVGWTENTKNMAYVSHFQIYLQGSDYDIDKAYIMGQSYDGNGIYIQWSPLFDYTSAETLAISKQLPVPERVTLIKSDAGIDITAELETILHNIDDSAQPISDDVRAINLTAYVNILKKINSTNGKINYLTPESPKLDKVMDILKQHIYYVVPENVAEAAYKNVASANIYAVSHDIRNRDQGYTAITMKTLQKAAENSPKGEQSASLNMLNPLTKYIMQYQNIVGKNVISIAANGEKVWFNAYYYWTKLLKEGRPNYLQFQTTLKRVAGRAGKKTNNLEGLKTVTKNSLPDLNPYDQQLKEVLLAEFGVDAESQEYVYVDQLISQLLSAATDNAKELILAKINAGQNFARMYVYLIMTGYNFDDIVQFMISPVSEFIDSMSNSNMFQDSDINNSPSMAINLAQGIVKSYSFLHGTIDKYITDETTGEEINKPENKSDYVRKALEKSPYYKRIAENIRNENNLNESDIIDLDTLMQGFILGSLSNPALNIATLLDTKDMEINTYLQYCQNIAYKLKGVASQYSSLSEMQADAVEFKKIYHLASEISSISSAWLGLNQGLPTDELGLLQRFSSMRKVIIDREKALGIDPTKMFTDSEKLDKIDKARKHFDRVVKNIMENNSALPQDVIEQALITAHEKGLMKTFDVYRYLTDKQYRRDMIDYNHIIKGTLNVLDMMEEIPHYKTILECLKSLAVSKQSLSSKSRLINTLMRDSGLEYLNDQQLKGIIRYVDKLNAVNFAKSISESISLDSSIEGFDTYFNKIKTDKIDLSTFSGMATFKHWIEHEFLDYLRDNHSDNPLVKHLQKVPENQRDILATDIDLLNPNTTTVTRQSYDEILRGMAEFEKVPYKDTGYSIADLFQLYNILVNNNQYGGERLTTTFKACSEEKSILNRYLKFIGEQDYQFKVLQDYELEDYYINAAPIVSTSAERFKTDKFIKVNDPVQGYVIKRRNEKNNSYEPYPLIPPKIGNESNDDKLQRVQNFAEFCPFEMPKMGKLIELSSAVSYEEELDASIVERIKNILLDLSSAGKLMIFKDC